MKNERAKTWFRHWKQLISWISKTQTVIFVYTEFLDPQWNLFFFLAACSKGRDPSTGGNCFGFLPCFWRHFFSSLINELVKNDVIISFSLTAVSSQCNWTVGHALEKSLRLWIPSLLCISTSACTGDLSQSFFEPFSGGSLTHSLVSFQWSGFSDQQMLLLTETAYVTRNNAISQLTSNSVHERRYYDWQNSR